MKQRKVPMKFVSESVIKPDGKRVNIERLTSEEYQQFRDYITYVFIDDAYKQLKLRGGENGTNNKTS